MLNTRKVLQLFKDKKHNFGKCGCGHSLYLEKIEIGSSEGNQTLGITLFCWGHPPDYYTINNKIKFYHNGERWIKYKDDASKKDFL